MKGIKGTITTILIIFCSSFSEAQLYTTPSQDTVKCIKEINAASYIFEGRILQKKHYNSDKQMITTGIFRIFTIFKGYPQIKVGTIKLITEQQGKDSNGNIIIPSHGGYELPPSDEDEGYIIFGRIANPAWCVDSTITDNTMTVISDVPVIFYSHNMNNYLTWYALPQFKHYMDVLNFFKENGLTVQDELHAIIEQ